MGLIIFNRVCFQKSDIVLTREIESWSEFANSLSTEEKNPFKKMLNEGYKIQLQLYKRWIFSN
jgi:hypothetical protein